MNQCFFFQYNGEMKHDQVALPELDPEKLRRLAQARRKQRKSSSFSKHSSSSDDDDDDDEDGHIPITFDEADYSWRADARFPHVRSPFPSSWSAKREPLELFVWDVKTHVEITEGDGVTRQVVRIYGLTEAEGHTVALDVHGFNPYFYCLPPSEAANHLQDSQAADKLCAHLQSRFAAYLQQVAREEQLSGKRKSNWKKDGGASPVMVSVQLERKRNIYTFYPPTRAEIEANERANAGQETLEDVRDNGGYREMVLRVETGTKWDADKLMRAINRVDQQGAQLDEEDIPVVFRQLPAITFECETLQHTDKLLNDLGIVGCGWIRVEAGHYSIRRDVPIRQLVESLRTTTCSNIFANRFFRNRPLTQAVAKCHVMHLVPLPDKQSFPNHMRILSFDLETTMLSKEDERSWSEPLNLDTSILPDDAQDEEDEHEEEEEVAAGEEEEGKLSLAKMASSPDPNYKENREPHAAIIQISAVLYEFPAGKIIHKAIFSLGSLLKGELQRSREEEEEDGSSTASHQEDGIEIQAFCFGNEPGNREQFEEQMEEERMLRAFTEYCAVADPDLYTGYNILGFDFDYLISRYSHYNLPALIGRSGCPVTVKEDRFESRAFGVRIYRRPYIDGRISMDMRVEVERGTRKKLRRYTLNAVCEAHLSDQTKLVRNPWPLLHARLCLGGGGGFC